MRLTAALRDCQAGGELAAPDFAALMAPFAPFESAPELAVAVSGGRDSLALALLAHDWVRERGGRVIGLIVDHGLRAESAGEAQATAELLRHRGVEAAILRWPGAKPRHGIQEAAREARYRLLLQECRRRGILHLLVAHHSDDQDETVAMRAGRDSGPDGLAGMAAIVEHGEARLLRPLLGVARDRLTATLRERNVRWIDDPSNVDPRFERARLRQNPKADVDDWREAGIRRAAREVALAAAAVELLELDVDGGIAADCTALDQLADDLRNRLLSRIVQALGGSTHPPRRNRLERAAARLSQAGERGRSGKARDFTLFGCRLMLRQAREDRRMRWIVRPESGRNDSRKGVQPLIPAAFFACAAPGAHHLDC